MAKKLKISSVDAIAVGDVYTDIPLLDWAKISVLVDTTGKKKAKYRHKIYRFISSISEILSVLNSDSV